LFRQAIIFSNKENIMNIKLSLTTLILSSSLAFAGGDIEPIEPEVSIPEIPIAESMMEEIVPESQKLGVYVGLGYSYMQLATDTPDEEFDANAISANVGYKFNQNIAIEARYTHSVSDVKYQTWNANDEIANSAMTNLGIYLKPQINLAGLGIYGLLGYGQIKLDNGTNSFTEKSFQYGIGTNFSVSEVSLFIDYRRLYDAEGFDDLKTDVQDVAVNSFTLGVNYEF
jgi:opacity protein-like surface antigen